MNAYCPVIELNIDAQICLAVLAGHDHPHTVRILARSWLFVIWHCWQDETAYDPARHCALQTLLNYEHQPAA